MIRVLHAVNNMHRAGLETMLMNYYRKIDKSKIQFDFLTHRNFKSDYDDEIVALGGKVFYAPRLVPQNYIKYLKFMDQFFKNHTEYSIIHSHIDAMGYLPLYAAKRAKIPFRIAHSHSTSIDLDSKYLIKQFFRHKITSVATHFLACGNEAGKFLFPKNEFTVIPNAIDSHKYRFNTEIRLSKREELGIYNEFVVGHVGRFTQAKNHSFIIKFFLDFVKVEPNSILVLVGIGEKMQETIDLVSNYCIQGKVLFLGNRSDVNELYQVMDVFILPSLYEGVPLVGVEAQFSGLPCVFSDRVPNEVMFSEKCMTLSIDSNSDEWISTIIKLKNNSMVERKSTYNSRFDIEIAKERIQKYYQDLLV